MPERLHIWSAALHRVLDVLAASAQPVADGDNQLYRWGEHIRDDMGDNTGQHGIHGTSEAVRALAAGIETLGPKSRYHRFLKGGVLSLVQWIDNPKKPIDLLKTVKVGEWLGALADGTGPEGAIERLTDLLLAGQDTGTGAWGWNPQEGDIEPLILPTLYALDGLVRVNRRFGLHSGEIKVALQFCLTNIQDDLPAADAEYEQIYTWKVYLYKLSEIFSVFEKQNGNMTDFRSQLERVLQSDAHLHPALKEIKVFDYRIKPSTTEEHAYCVLPVGLMQLRTELWAKATKLNIQLEQRLFADRVTEFIRLIYSPLEFPFHIVGSCAYAARTLVDFGSEIDAQLVSETGRRSERKKSAELLQPQSAISDPFEDDEVRQQVYLDLMRSEGVQEVEVLRPLLEGYSGAHLDLCEIALETGTTEILQVLKLDEAHNVNQERSGVELAERLISSMYRVHFISSYSVPNTNKGVLRYEFEGDAFTSDRVRSFLSFLDAESSTQEVVKVIKKIYSTALNKALEPVKLRHTSLTKLKTYFEQRRGNKYWAEVESGYALLKSDELVQPISLFKRLLLQFPFKTVHDLFVDSDRSREVWKLSFPGAIASHAHGDLNPRNILIVREEEEYYRPVLIDFHRFGSNVPLAIDFARLEAGIQIKGLHSYIAKAATDDESHEYLIKYEKLINGPYGFGTQEYERSLISVSLPPELRKVATFVQEIRENYINKVGRKEQYTRAYYAILMFNYLSYLRPIYSRVLKEQQKLFAFYSATCIFKRHFLYPAK